MIKCRKGREQIPPGTEFGGQRQPAGRAEEGLQFLNVPSLVLFEK